MMVAREAALSSLLSDRFVLDLPLMVVVGRSLFVARIPSIATLQGCVPVLVALTALLDTEAVSVHLTCSGSRNMATYSRVDLTIWHQLWV